MALCIEFKHQGETRTATILKNRGITWMVRDMDGEEYQVQKRHVVRQWEEVDPAACSGCGAVSELNEEGFCQVCQESAEAALSTTPGMGLAGQLGAAARSEPATAKEHREKKTKPPTAERDPNLVTLKELCFEMELEPRIARRMLRKGLGNIGTGSRWEWMKGTAELSKVRAVLLKDEAK